MSFSGGKHRSKYRFDSGQFRVCPQQLPPIPLFMCHKNTRTTHINSPCAAYASHLNKMLEFKMSFCKCIFFLFCFRLVRFSCYCGYTFHLQLKTKSFRGTNPSDGFFMFVKNAQRNIPFCSCSAFTYVGIRFSEFFFLFLRHWKDQSQQKCHIVLDLMHGGGESMRTWWQISHMESSAIIKFIEPKCQRTLATKSVYFSIKV